MRSFWRAMRVAVSLLTVISTIFGLVPWVAVGEVRAAEPAPLTTPNPQMRATTWDFTLYLPLVLRSYRAPAPITALMEPGIGGRVGAPDGSVNITFTGVGITETVEVRYEATTPPSSPPGTLAVGGPAFSVEAVTVAGQTPVTYFPYAVTVYTNTSPWYSVYTPSIQIEVFYTDVDVWGLDLSRLALYHRAGPGTEWTKIPTAVYRDQHLMKVEVDTLGEFVPMAPLAIHALSSPSVLGEVTGLSMGQVLSDTGTYKKLVLDADDDVGHAYWPNAGEQREIVYSVRLVKAVKERLERDKCRVDVLLTRESESLRWLSRATRAQMARDFGAEMFATMTFNALTGSPWGWIGDGGSLVWSGGDGSDRALGQALLNQMSDLKRPGKWGGTHFILPYSEFTALSASYAHLETLYLDHNFDWPIINTGFDAISDAMYSAVRAQLEGQGMFCGDDPNNPPPYPAPPSAEMLQRWRDLGYQNYERYGADPVSFSTGNHIVQARLTRIPGRGGVDWNFTLTYNAQDTRCDLLGCGWSFPYNARLQRYSDDSVTVALWDGRTYYHTWNGSGYDAPAGVFDKLEKTDTGWTWTTPGDLVLTFEETVGGVGVLTEWRDRNGNALHFAYDLSRQDAWQNGEEVPRPPLTEILNDAGRKVTVSANAEGRIERLQLWDGRAYTFSYDSESNLTRIGRPGGTLRRFAYDSRHRMVKEWDGADILFLQSTYDDRDRVIEQVDASGTRSYLTYDVGSRTTTYRDNAGNNEVYEWDDLNRVTGEQDASGNRTNNIYDVHYNLTERTDANGSTTVYAYDERGNIVARHDPIPDDVTYTTDVTRWAYDDHNRVVSMTNALDHTWRYEYDARGNMIRSIAPDNSETRATYNAWGQPLSVTDGEGRTTFYKYDGDGNLIRTTYPDGSVSMSTYDDASRETSYTDANGHTVRFTYDDRDNIERIVDPKTAPSTFEYDDNDLLVRAVNRLTHDRLYRYDENLKLVAERDEEGRWTTYGYDTLYRRVVMTDTAGFTTHYRYDEAGRLTSTTDATGATARYTHDENGNTVAVTDALNGTTRMIYDAANRLKYLIDANGNRTEYCYDAEDQLIRTIGPRGEVTDYSYDALGRLVEVKDPLSHITRYEYDNVGNRTAMINPLDARTDYTYDDRNRVIAIAAPVLDDDTRPTTAFAYDPVGNTLVITSPSGFVTSFTYDANDNVTTITDPLGGTTRYAYDAEDRPLTVTDANDHAESITYNKAGLPIEVEDALGYTTTLRYDDSYNMVRMTNAMGRSMLYDYDPLGRLSSTTDPLEHVTAYDRDPLGRVRQVTDANGHATDYGYDALGQLVTVTDALSGTTSYAYDAVGNLTVITDANKSVTRFEFNFLNQLKREINPLGNTWEYAYDDAGRLTRRRDAMWHATYYDYDSNGRLIEISYGAADGGQHPVTFAYDPDSNETEMCDALGCTTHAYDALGRPTGTTDWLGRTITRTYDAVGNLTGLTYPNGYETQYRYNANNWLTMFIDPHADASVYMHNPLGQVTEIRHANNTVASFDYDPVGRLTALTNFRNGDTEPQSAYAYAMDKVGNRTQVIETRAAFDGSESPVELVHSYAYDALDRLVAAGTNLPATATGYAFDAVGNRLGKTGTVLAPDPDMPALPVASRPEAVGYTYNAANQLLEIEEPGSTTALNYNANGDRVRETEVLTDGTTLITDYVYDREDRLTGVTKTVSDTAALTVTMVATYTYDGYGRRALREVVEYTSPITSHVSHFTYLYDGLDIIGVTLETGETVTETYTYLAPSPLTGLRRPLQMERLPNPATGFPGDRHWYQLDGLDSVVALTDVTGEISDALLYEEYGQQLGGVSELQVFAYTGQDYDSETGLTHFYARYYDAKKGAWLVEDKFGGVIYEPLTANRYGYVTSNPVRWLDVLGYCRDSDSPVIINPRSTEDTEPVEPPSDPSCDCMQCPFTEVWFAPRQSDIQGRGCVVFVEAYEEDLLGGNVRTVSLIQPLRDVPIIGQMIDAVPWVKGEKWAVEVVKAIEGNQSWKQTAWVILKDIIIDELSGKIVGDALNFKLFGREFSITDGEAFSNWVVGPIIGQIADSLESTGSQWAKAYLSARDWPYADLKHCIYFGVSSICYPNYRDFIKEYPHTHEFLDRAAVINSETCCASGVTDISGGGGGGAW